MLAATAEYCMQLQFIIMPCLQEIEITFNKLQLISERDQFLILIDQKVLVHLCEPVIESVCLQRLMHDQVIECIQGVENKVRVHFIGEGLQLSLRPFSVQLIYDLRIQFPFLAKEKYFIYQCEQDHRRHANRNKAEYIRLTKIFFGHFLPCHHGEASRTGCIQGGHSAHCCDL